MTMMVTTTTIEINKNEIQFHSKIARIELFVKCLESILQDLVCVSQVFGNQLTFASVWVSFGKL